jgi:hypothetical protein
MRQNACRGTPGSGSARAQGSDGGSARFRWQGARRPRAWRRARAGMYCLDVRMKAPWRGVVAWRWQAARARRPAVLGLRLRAPRRRVRDGQAGRALSWSLLAQAPCRCVLRSWPWPWLWLVAEAAPHAFHRCLGVLVHATPCQKHGTDTAAHAGRWMCPLRALPFTAWQSARTGSRRRHARCPIRYKPDRTPQQQ